MKLIRVDNDHPDFKELITQLDADLHSRYLSQQTAYDTHNVIKPLNTAMIGYVSNHPVACGCFREVDNTTAEIKRMYVESNYRRRGYSTMLLMALEAWCSELGYLQTLLETGKKQPEAIGLYTQCGYGIIENYGVYTNLDNSVCMMKTLTQYPFPGKGSTS